mmetsp:Transcript_27700/g.53866  ORF Transcript_27700/g.53866 Transcript_27700/m.53866 type:complete len:541 (+) Transcript_27700:95-1717(+)
MEGTGCFENMNIWPEDSLGDIFGGPTYLEDLFQTPAEYANSSMDTTHGNKEVPVTREGRSSIEQATEVVFEHAATVHPRLMDEESAGTFQAIEDKESTRNQQAILSKAPMDYNPRKAPCSSELPKLSEIFVKNNYVPPISISFTLPESEKNRAMEIVAQILRKQRVQTEVSEDATGLRCMCNTFLPTKQFVMASFEAKIVHEEGNYKVTMEFYTGDKCLFENTAALFHQRCEQQGLNPQRLHSPCTRQMRRGLSWNKPSSSKSSMMRKHMCQCGKEQRCTKMRFPSGGKKGVEGLDIANVLKHTINYCDSRTPEEKDAVKELKSRKGKDLTKRDILNQPKLTRLYNLCVEVEKNIKAINETPRVGRPRKREIRDRCVSIEMESKANKEGRVWQPPKHETSKRIKIKGKLSFYFEFKVAHELKVRTGGLLRQIWQNLWDKKRDPFDMHVAKTDQKFQILLRITFLNAKLGGQHEIIRDILHANPLVLRGDVKYMGFEDSCVPHAFNNNHLIVPSETTWLSVNDHTWGELVKAWSVNTGEHY